MLTSVDHRVAIIGMSCRFPGAPTLAQFWELLRAGGDAITDVPPERFDAAYFGISPHEARRMDPQHRLMLESVHDAVDDAGLRADDLAGNDTAVYTGVRLMSEYWPMLVQADMIDLHSVLGARRRHVRHGGRPDLPCAGPAWPQHVGRRDVRDGAGVRAVGPQLAAPR
ncbi:beta-ketoacyl synthase N-terminal-like domain-containing protein [Amycolatopsis mediterranei]|uniref:beta-ketoacyl synthase N-terminal-like domain-containing protein n=1 Tax=Amycolatopsis mediterranei TaxID=33910 RepID=UPI003431CB99